MARIRECIIVGGKASGSHVLGKMRDRNYNPKLQVVRQVTPDGLEVVFIEDLTTGYLEGMNSNGIGVVNAALLVSSDEKAADDYWMRQKKKKGSSNDGPRIKQALALSKLSEVIKSLVGYDEGLKGHTLVGSPTSLYSIEMTSKHNPIVKKLDPSTGYDVRTNHGEDHEGAGYTPEKHPEDYLSSKIRKATAQVKLTGVDDADQIMPAMASQEFEGESNMNMMRRTPAMRSSSQILLNLDDLELTCYLFPGECSFDGIVDETPDNYEPKINIVVRQYGEE